MENIKDNTKEAEAKKKAEATRISAEMEKYKAPPKAKGSKKAATFQKGELGFEILKQIEELGLKLSCVTEKLLAHALDVKTTEDVGKVDTETIQRALGIV